MSFCKSKVFLKPPPKGQTRFGHPWIYRSQIKDTENSPKPGDLVEVLTSGRRPLGLGYFNPHSEITVRFLSRSAECLVDRNFFISKFSKAREFRGRFIKETNAYRLISSEADGLPGLIVDLYGEVAVVQFLTAGMENLRPLALGALDEMGLAPRGVYEKSDSSSRRIEGLQEKTGWIRKDCGDDTVIFEKNVRYHVRFSQGQKTGFYLDQRENRILLAETGVKGRVLDAFCYSGGFGLHMALAGATVLGVDSQKEAIEEAEANRALNTLSAGQLQFKMANVFDELKSLEREKDRFQTYYYCHDLKYRSRYIKQRGSKDWIFLCFWSGKR